MDVRQDNECGVVVIGFQALNLCNSTTSSNCQPFLHVYLDMKNIINHCAFHQYDTINCKKTVCVKYVGKIESNSRCIIF
ncbi:hypothetical protein PsorP6_002281 [Peronosclerospora sorghi]|uniref:Uncharacterized protein n=1 Tax=Peronosclerospora sorghi TaxID=230839 RepID=A0ACC0WSM2_9STRA|nr:hypothetical protein PsorP6_002281 [Peronosclerospora sorghi]